MGQVWDGLKPSGNVPITSPEINAVLFATRPYTNTLPNWSLLYLAHPLQPSASGRSNSCGGVVNTLSRFDKDELKEVKKK